MVTGSPPKIGWLYVNAVKSIQSFIFATNKLKEITGGSALVEMLPNDLLDKTLAALNFQKSTDYEIMLQAAGGACLLFRDRNNAQEMARVWPFLTALYAPTIEVTQGIVPCDSIPEALSLAEKVMRTNRNIVFPQLPQPGSLTEYCRRTGLAATTVTVEDGKAEPIDALTEAKLNARQNAGKRLLRKIIPQSRLTTIDDSSRWAMDFPQMLGGGVAREKGYLAVIHADANRLGGVRMQLGAKLAILSPEEAVQKFKQFTSAVDRATVAATQAALEPIMSQTDAESPPGIYPFRPIVCAGDDLTMVMRADLAFAFTTAFLENFERESAKNFGELDLDLPSLTACAGIAFVHQKFPFAAAYELSESLCSHSKKALNREASGLSFFRVTTSAVRNYEQIIKDELSTGGCQLTMNPYRANPAATSVTAPLFSDLRKLADIVAQLPKTSFRQVVGMAAHNQVVAQVAFERLCDVAGASRKSSLVAALTAITGATEEPLWRKNGALSETPLFDALELNRIER